MRLRFRLAASLALAAAAAVSNAAADVGPTYALRNCRIVPVVGPPVEKGLIVVRDGLIEALGPADKVAIPEDAEIIEGEGLVAVPGFVLAHANLFLPPPPAEPERFGAPAAAPPAEDRFPPGPSALAYDQFQPRRAAIEGWHKAGVTTVLVAPHRGIFQGRSVILSLNGERRDAMVLQPAFALHVNFTTERSGYPSSLMGTMAHIRQSFLDAGHYAAVRAQYGKVLRGMKRPEFNPFLEDLAPYVRDRRPVVFQCQSQEDVKRALKLIGEFKLNGLLSGANEAWRAAAALKASPAPLLVTLDFRPPQTSVYAGRGEEARKKAEADIYPANAAVLDKEGLTFALTALGLNDGASFQKNVRAAIKAGLPKEKALAALTIVPARILGLDRVLGSLEPGKIADVVLFKGELFEEKTTVDRVLVDGVLFKY